MRDNGKNCAENVIMFNYDLELPSDFRPKAIDGEVEEFQLWDAEKLVSEVELTNNFKDNCNLILIDFFIRHGLISPEYPGYTNIATMLHYRKKKKKSPDSNKLSTQDSL